MDAQGCQARGEIGVVGGQHAPVAESPQVLAGEEAEAASPADAAGAALAIFGANRLGRILDDRNLAPAGENRDGVHVGTAAEQVYGNDGPDFGVGAQDLGGAFRVEVEGAVLDVGKNGNSAQAGNGTGCGKKGVRCREDFLAGADIQG